MIIEQHYDDEVLIDLLEEAEEDKHVPVCDTCTGTLESFRDLAGALHDDSVWDERELSATPKPETKNLLRAFAATTKSEDAAAGLIVAKLLAASADERTALLDKNPEWLNAGVVRRLLMHVDTINYTDPRAAVEIATFAAQIAVAIDPALYRINELAKLRATALREQAWCLYFVGSFPEAVVALDRADAYLRHCIVSDCDRAEVQLLRARVYRDQERLEEAIALTRESASVFRLYANRRRAAVADAIQSTVLVHLRRFSEALAIDLPIASDMSLDEESRATALTRAAYCFREISAFDEAKVRYVQAIAVFERLGLIARRSLARWGLARVLLDEGRRYDSALALFKELRGEFEELGMGHDIALVSLDAAETLLALNRPSEVVELCRGAMEYFGKAGLAYSRSAMTALAYLREAAELGTLTPAAVKNVRTFFEILPKQPHLVFAYPA